MDDYEQEETFYDLWDNCISLSVFGISSFIFRLVATNIAFGLIVSLGKLPDCLFHLLSLLCGLHLLNTLESVRGKTIFIGYVVLSYLFIYFGKQCLENLSFLRRHYVKAVCILGLVSTEYFGFDPETWMQIRGPVMIFTMKLISIHQDVQNGEVSVNFLQYLGYCLSGTSILFGPWVSFEHYVLLNNSPPKKNIRWFVGVLQALYISICFLIISNCLASYLITDNFNTLLVSYREALSFRTSHYFISYLSESAMLSAGYKSFALWQNPSKWRFNVVSPWEIETPKALASVVIHWNRPMHDFLKKYVYRPCLPSGKFVAVFATFLVSSFLHGFELHVSVVLITIGVFSYIQLITRNHIANVFDCCIKVYPCKNCPHKYKRDSTLCRLLLAISSVLTIIHLIFLGVLMDPTAREEGIYHKWNKLYFCSLWIMLFKCLIAFL